MAVGRTIHRQTPLSAGNDTSSGGIVLKKLSPAAAGAKRLATRFGQSLVCVRYREDTVRGRRFTTVELIIDERPLPPPAAVRVAYEEVELRSQVKAAGGTWDGKRKLWLLPRAAVRKLKLAHRVVPEKSWIWTNRHTHIWIRFSIFGQKCLDMEVSS